MTNYEEAIAAGNARMRKTSGQVDDPRPLVAFLYTLLRDHVVEGAVEEVMVQLDSATGPWQFTNGWLARYCQDLADRLERDGRRLRIENDTDLSGLVPEDVLGGALFEWEAVDGDHAFVRQGAADAPQMMCRTCRAANPDCRRVLSIDPGMVQVCWNCKQPLPDLPPEVPEDLPPPADPAKGEDPCGVASPDGRLICMLPRGHEGPHGAEGTL